ncbi:MAG TPA: hypothetical protein GX745_01870 [Clostridiales bacterium]|nr:hypothetical protein [Clostridiales bacterium]
MEHEIIEINGKQYKRYAHEVYKIRKVGTDEIYDEAIDLMTATYEYELTDQLRHRQEDIDNDG